MRCVKEFANYRKLAVKNNELMNPGIKKEILLRISETLCYFERDMITPCEAMRLLSEDCMRDGEDMGAYWEDENKHDKEV